MVSTMLTMSAILAPVFFYWWEFFSMLGYLELGSFGISPFWSWATSDEGFSVMQSFVQRNFLQVGFCPTLSN